MSHTGSRETGISCPERRRVSPWSSFSSALTVHGAWGDLTQPLKSNRSISKPGQMSSPSPPSAPFPCSLSVPINLSWCCSSDGEAWEHTVTLIPCRAARSQGPGGSPWTYGLKTSPEVLLSPSEHAEEIYKTWFPVPAHFNRQDWPHPGSPIQML